MKTKILGVLRSLHQDESGQDLIEYALVAALIAFGAVGSLSVLASSVNLVFSKVGSTLVSAMA